MVLSGEVQDYSRCYLQFLKVNISEGGKADSLGNIGKVSISILISCIQGLLTDEEKLVDSHDTFDDELTSSFIRTYEVQENDSLIIEIHHVFFIGSSLIGTFIRA